MDSRSNDYILAKYDISGIQRYIFATNRLKENVGASCQVTKILEVYLPDSIREAVTQTDAYVIDWQKEDKLQLLKNQSIIVEIIYIGGGNALVLFQGMEVCQQVSRNLARKVAENCQGIYLAAAYVEMINLENFSEDVEKLNRKMAEKKAGMIKQPVYSPFPVVEQDNANHQPITRRYCLSKEENMDMTEMQYQKWMAYQETKGQKDGKLYPIIDGSVNYDYPVDMDALCRDPGGNSYIAVVHIDGNGMGAQVQKVLAESKKYETAVPTLRENSKKISSVFENTYQEMLKGLFRYLKLPDKECEEEIQMPLRPIVMDGDDFTFVCTADLAIPLAAGFLLELMKGQKEETEKITACAGIAFVHSHFPFYEAYCIAEESCSDAKKKWYQRREKESSENCFLDFRILKGSEVGGTVRHEDWHMRPYSVEAKGHEKKEDSLVRLCEAVKKMENWPSNRLHKISHAMLGGEYEMEFLQKEFKSRGYDIKDLTQAEDWTKSPLYDALEIRGLCEMKLLEEFWKMQEK